MVQLSVPQRLENRELRDRPDYLSRALHILCAHATTKPRPSAHAIPKIRIQLVQTHGPNKWRSDQYHRFIFTTGLWRRRVIPRALLFTARSAKSYRPNSLAMILSSA
jgi:hypothetical protein